MLELPLKLCVKLKVAHFLTVKPCLHDTTCCHTGLTTSKMFVYTIQLVGKLVVQPGLTTGWTNSCSFNTVVKLVVKPVWQPAVLCIQTFNRLSNRVCQTGCTARFSCQTVWQPGWMFVCMIQPVVQLVVSCKRGFRNIGRTMEMTGLQCWANNITYIGPLFSVNIGPILLKCELSNIGQIFRTICNQYCMTYLSNVVPILLAGSLQCWANNVTNIGPTFTVNIGPILLKCELSNIGQIFRTICSQYCMTHLSNIVSILLAGSLQCWANNVTNIGPMFTVNIGPILLKCELSNIG